MRGLLLLVVILAATSCGPLIVTAPVALCAHCVERCREDMQCRRQIDAMTPRECARQCVEMCTTLRCDWSPQTQ